MIVCKLPCVFDVYIFAICPSDLVEIIIVPKQVHAFFWRISEKYYKYLPIVNFGRLKFSDYFFKGIILFPTQIFSGLKRVLKLRITGIYLTLWHY
jgi:hypothetical protein